LLGTQGIPDLQTPQVGLQAQQGVLAPLGSIGIGTPSEQPMPPRPAFRQGLGDQVFSLRAPLGRATLQGRVTGPVRLIQQIARAWSLTNSELANLLAYPSETLVPAVLEGRMTFATETDRGDRVRIMYAIPALWLTCSLTRRTKGGGFGIDWQFSKICRRWHLCFKSVSPACSRFRISSNGVWQTVRC